MFCRGPIRGDVEKYDDTTGGRFPECLLRPRLITLLETGELRCTKVGVHRRIRLKDLVDYKDKIRQQGSDAMDELVEIAQKTNLGY